jgi:hypothetical protein
VPPGEDQSAHPIVQKALTNVIRHAAASSACLTVRYDPGSLTLEITDDGPAEPDRASPRAGPSGPGSGPGQAGPVSWVIRVPPRPAPGTGSLAYASGSRCSAGSSPPARGRAVASGCSPGSRFQR